MVYTVIGIKNKWLYIFFSTTYLTSLAVTVLIVYLMSPPVTNALQGGFFVAVFISGLIFGALSLVFTDITDGLGCLLGGFCISMWFLTLKEDGLIRSTSGRAIFIACVSFATFCLSFSHYTRTYGLIACISFAGATIAVLGIDCFSRAGLKEFWLYLWNLNSNTFPLNTNTYPITRGIRVEVASVILIFLLGLVSQLKLWKLVKERRERNAAVRLEHDQNTEREESERGRIIENDFTRERAQWEAAYGDKQAAGIHTDSAIGSSDDSIQKTSVSVRGLRRSNSESMEMVDMSRSKEGSQKALVSRASSKRNSGPTITVQILEDDGIQRIDADGNIIRPNGTETGKNSVLNSNSSSARVSTEIRLPEDGENTHTVSTRTSVRSSVPPPPAIVPLPFTIPTEESADNEDNVSVSTVPEFLPGHRPTSKRYSAQSALNRFSMSRNSTDHSESREALIIPHIDDDRASSVAATLDDLDEDDMSLPALSPQLSPLKLGFEDYASAPLDLTLTDGESPGAKTRNETGTAKSDDEDEPLSAKPSGSPISNQTSEEAPRKLVKHHSLTISTDPKPSESRPKRASIGSQKRRSGTSGAIEDDGRSRRRSKSMKSIPQSDSSQIESQVGSLKEILPEKLSKIVLSYRTNEWAKHLELAEKPDLDEIKEPESPGIQVDHGFAEAAAPAAVEVKPQPPPLVTTKLARDVSQSSATNPYRQANAIRSSSSLLKQSPHDMPSSSVSKTASSATVNTIPILQHTGPYIGGAGTPATLSRSNSAAMTRGARSSSMPLMNQTLVESPIEEDPETSGAARFTPSPMPGGTLMGKREGMVRNKASAMSLNPHSTMSNVNVAALNDAASARGVRVDRQDSDNISLSERKQMIDQENMTLAQRKQLIQNQQLQPHQQQRQGTWPLAEHIQGFDSHQPKRTSGIDQSKREAMLASWRESVRQEMAPVQPVVADEGRRIAMINERKQKEMEKQQQVIAATYRDTVFDSMMRRGDMLDLHKEAMRRMQAAANKNA